MTTGFLTSRVDVTHPDLPLTYGDQPGMAVFLWTGSVFIMWICLDIARVCHNNVPHMHAPAFRSAFMLIAIGCILFSLVLIDRLLYGAVIRNAGVANATATALTVFYWAGETFAVLLVSLGLLLPRVAGHLEQGAFGLRARLLLLEIEPIWNRVVSSHHQLILEKRRTSRFMVLSGHAETQLHRRLVEIRDCEMASPSITGRLDPHDKAVVERAELALEKRSVARTTLQLTNTAATRGERPWKRLPSKHLPMSLASSATPWDSGPTKALSVSASTPTESARHSE
ncbi:DUF6545 domain-containing protein [Arthrobacter sp. FW306-2-2C-D06B]|uniref:DUF6545 domain-containing protein n=1 Tax=Arthrobacter sp. FW306-2-2C-D06B TaxID=2879618 RepID=UPI0023516A64|nr:DUF6545 domain-containing protein [Arthrobacter sp. FW306-2-2C-D06B]UKA60424.1 hypothetical protein LFT47_08890 [Arthrobacter sp. FW306-2-2C-D06B]